jgi:hypothetical protein
MNIKKIALTVTCAGLLGTTAFGQPTQLKGTVTGLTKTEIMLKSGSDNFKIKRTPATAVTSGSLKVGLKVTLDCDSADVSKNTAAPGASTAPAPKSR